MFAWCASQSLAFMCWVKWRLFRSSCITLQHRWSSDIVQHRSLHTHNCIP